MAGIIKKIPAIVKGNIKNALHMESELSKERMMLCDNCEKERRIVLFKVCSVCGCVLKAKTKVDDEQCPLGKW